MAEGATEEKTDIKPDEADNDDDKTTANDDDAGQKDSQADDKLSGGKLDVEEILDEYGLDSPEELKEFLASLNEMKGKIGDNDLDTLLENTKTLNQYQENWKAREEEKRRESETPEQTIARLEKEKKELQTKHITQAERIKKSREAEAILDGFYDTVNSTIRSNKSLPKEYRPFATKYLGIDNPINAVDISDKAAVRRIAKTSVEKDMADFEQTVIKRYLAGKVKVPNVTPTEPTPGATSETDARNPKTLSEAKKIMMQSVGAFVKK